MFHQVQDIGLHPIQKNRNGRQASVGSLKMYRLGVNTTLEQKQLSR